jgi:TPR repeat protein
LLIEQSGKDHRDTFAQLFNTDPGEPQSTPSMKQLRRGAEQGDPNAEYLLGLAYDVGVGLHRTLPRQGTWYRKAADQGHAGAQFNLGHLYADGRGVPQDFVQAHMWLNPAAAGSQPGARNERELVAKKMTRSQITEALRLAREWQPKGEVRKPSTTVTPLEAPDSTNNRTRPQ